jgi:hypothetical protein
MGLCLRKGVLYKDEKKVLVQIGHQFFELNYWGKLRGNNKDERGRDLAKMLKEDKYSFRLLREEER